eukprot:8392033-Pyramimonas_sp.AAC.1
MRVGPCCRVRVSPPAGSTCCHARYPCNWTAAGPLGRSSPPGILLVWIGRPLAHSMAPPRGWARAA